MNEDKQLILETGKFYFLNQKYDKAIEMFRKGAESFPDDADIYFNLGVAYEGINDLEHAKDCFEKVLEIDREYAEAERHLEKIVNG